MAIQAKWGTKNWLVDEKEIMPMKSLSMTYKVKENNYEERDLMRLSCSTDIFQLGDISVRSQIESWRKELEKGISYPFYIGNDFVGNNFYNKKANDPTIFILKEVNISNILLDNKGEFLKATIDLSFEEYLSELD